MEIIRGHAVDEYSNTKHVRRLYNQVRWCADTPLAVPKTNKTTAFAGGWCGAKVARQVLRRWGRFGRLYWGAQVEWERNVGARRFAGWQTVPKTGCRTKNGRENENGRLKRDRGKTRLRQAARGRKRGGKWLCSSSSSTRCYLHVK